MPGVRKVELESYFEIAGRAANAHVNAKGLPLHVREDLTQEGLLWLLEHPNRVEHARFKDGSKKLYGSTLVAEIRRYYVSSGADRMFDAGEETFVDKEWTPDMVELVFPAVYDPEYTPFREQSDEAERFSERDPSEAGTWLAMIADASSARDAYGKTAVGIRFVFRHAVLNQSYGAIAVEENVSDWTARQKVREALVWMARWLNGDRGDIPE